MKSRAVAVCIGVFFLLALVGTFQALKGSSAGVQAKPQKVEEKCVKARGGQGEKDENIKVNTYVNDVNAPARPAPPAKSKEKARGAIVGGVYYSTFTADNYTPYLINIYINGNLVGTVGPWGSASGYYLPDTYTVYGKAFFSDGSALSWGPRVISLAADYTWSLTQ